jgi:hypothetical protein
MILLIDTVSVLIGATISIVILACISILATLLAKQMLKYEKIKKPSEQNVSKPQNIDPILKTFPFADVLSKVNGGTNEPSTPVEQNVSKPQNIEAILKTFPFADIMSDVLSKVNGGTNEPSTPVDDTYPFHRQNIIDTDRDISYLDEDEIREAHSSAGEPTFEIIPNSTFSPPTTNEEDTVSSARKEYSSNRFSTDELDAEILRKHKGIRFSSDLTGGTKVLSELSDFNGCRDGKWYSKQVKLAYVRLSYYQNKKKSLRKNQN